VTRLGLDKDPAFTRESLSWRVLSTVRQAFGLEQTTPSNHDLAVSDLMRQVTVTNEPRSYLITVAVTTTDPERAARLANAVAFEYLRDQLLQQLTDAYASVEREVADVSSIYGRRHPRYLSVRTRLELLEADLGTLRQGTSTEDLVTSVVGQSLLPAKTVLVPSGPNLILILSLTGGAALALGAWLALLLERGLIGRNQPGYSAVRGDEAIMREMPSDAESSPLTNVPVRRAADGPMAGNGKIAVQTISSNKGIGNAQNEGTHR
jgi:uncharacterized protein involved in exopolysaccharide biosynthesis